MPTGGKCSRCQNKKLAGLYFALPYKEKALTKKLIYQFKYPPYIKSLAKVLAEIMAEHLLLAKNNAETIWENSVLVPVPMEIKKMKDRGYNQAQELAHQLGQIINVPTVFGNLVKAKETPSQMTLSGKEREANLIDAFVIKKPEQIQDKTIFLIDDVYTTGSTMEECAKTLKEAGAKKVWGIAMTRDEFI